MNYDFAIIYFGLSRTFNKVYYTHVKYIYNILKLHNLSYKIIAHTWKTEDSTYNLSDDIFDIDRYKIDNCDDFILNVNMDNYFYKDVFLEKGQCGDGEWFPNMVKNHICMLESQKRGLKLLEGYMEKGYTFNNIIYLRMDLMLEEKIPIDEIILNTNKIHIPNHSNYEGFNDQIAIMNYNNACIYGKRIIELADFRKTNGRIVGEKYLKYIIDKYHIPVNAISFKYYIQR